MLKSVSWQEISDKVKKASSELHEIICELSPGKNHPLFLMKSNYGEDINLAYSEDSNTSPLLALQLSRVTEKFDEYNTGGASNFHTYTPGDLLFLDRAVTYLEELPYSDTSKYASGTRSAFMVPKISDSRSHKRILSHYKLNISAPKTVHKHWEVFREIANSKLQPYKWSSELLYFSEAWLKHKDDKKWLRFYKYIYRQAFLQNYSLNMEEFFWDTYLDNIKSIKCGPYSVETVKRILDILLLSKHGFTFAYDDEDYLPIKQIQNAYSEVYQTGDNAPIIMHANKYNKNLRDNGIPIYYSLSVPDIKKIKYISRGIQSANQELKMLVKLNTELTNLVSVHPEVGIDPNIKFKYFHSEDNVSMFSESIQSIQKIDPTLQKIFKTQYPGKMLSSYSNFLRGSVAVTTSNFQ